MSNISRRQFLKGAGVATLAVAAAGVLAGCSAEEVLTKDVKVVFMCNGATVGDQNYLKVAQDKTTVKVSEIPNNYFPVGYKTVSTGELKIAKLPTGEDGVKVMLDEIEVPVDIYYYEVVDGKEVDRMIFEASRFMQARRLSPRRWQNSMQVILILSWAMVRLPSTGATIPFVSRQRKTKSLGSFCS